MQNKQILKLIKQMPDDEAIGTIWGACIDWYSGDEYGACVSINNLPKLTKLIIAWKDQLNQLKGTDAD